MARTALLILRRRSSATRARVHDVPRTRPRRAVRAALDGTGSDDDMVVVVAAVVGQCPSRQRISGAGVGWFGFLVVVGGVVNGGFSALILLQKFDFVTARLKLRCWCQCMG